jgi:predicted nucleotidyltransferase component of viral defense system
VTKRPVKDVAASVRQRLSNNAKETGRPFQEVLQYFAMERFLYRLSKSPHADKFILKGALMLSAWHAPVSRPTKDIDLLARMKNKVSVILPVMRDVCNQEVEPDGLTFDADTLQGAAIKEDADYEGIRIVFKAYLQNARLQMQIDMGFGDVVFPAPTETEYPTILDYPPPKLRAYSRETAIAEKFEAMVKLGHVNSRMKDFYDIWLLSRQFDFDGQTLATAVTKTFANRHTPVSSQPAALTAAFATDPAKITQWRGFLRKSRLKGVPEELTTIVDAMRGLLLPLVKAIHEGKPFDHRWHAPGPWTQSARPMHDQSRRGIKPRNL